MLWETLKSALKDTQRVNRHPALLVPAGFLIPAYLVYSLYQILWDEKIAITQAQMVTVAGHDPKRLLLFGLIVAFFVPLAVVGFNFGVIVYFARLESFLFGAKYPTGIFGRLLPVSSITHFNGSSDYASEGQRY